MFKKTTIKIDFFGLRTIIRFDVSISRVVKGVLLKEKGMKVLKKIKTLSVLKKKWFVLSFGFVLLMLVLSFVVQVGYVLTVLAVVGFLFFSSGLKEGEDILKFDENKRRREIFSELKEVNNILKNNPSNLEALDRFNELKKELDEN